MSVFNSFWMAGYECSDQLNAFGNRVDLLKETGHLQRITEDYTALRSLNISTVREGIRWSVVEQSPYNYNFEEVLLRINAAKEAGIQILWDVCHFGFPDDLTPLHPMFARRFSHLCRAFILFCRDLLPDEPIIVTPINEVSFLSWLGGDVRGTSPYCTGFGWEVKYAYMKAYIEGIAAMKEADDNFLVLSTEPLVNIFVNHEELTDPHTFCPSNEHQFQVLDILTGRICPELGGREEYLDIVGLNYYHNNQWFFPSNDYMCWKSRDAARGWRSLHNLTIEVYNRYKRPIVISETSHFGEERPLWMDYIGQEIYNILDDGLPLAGVCIYPILDRPDWDFPERWHHSGVWDIYDTNSLERVLHGPTFDAVSRAQTKIEEVLLVN